MSLILPLPTKTMLHDTATFVIIVPQAVHYTPFRNRYTRTLQSGMADRLYKLPHPDSPLHPAGTSTASLLHRLGHPEQNSPVIHNLTPAMLRDLRHLVYSCRRHGARLHLVGLLDNSSPYGSRRAVEAVLRLIKPSGIKVALHLGVWHPIPKEFRRGVHEIRSLCNSSIELASLFPVSAIQQTKVAKKFIDGIQHPDLTSTNKTVTFPLHHPVILTEEPLGQNDVFLFATHRLHDFDALYDEIEQLASASCSSLDTTVQTEPMIERFLDRSKHIMTVSTRRHYIDAYFGDNLAHPYYESIIHPSSLTMLEMLISPHFGYSQKPNRTVIIVDEVTHPSYDWLLGAFIKRERTSPYFCCFLHPTSLDGSLVLSNMDFNNAPTYTDLFRY